MIPDTLREVELDCVGSVPTRIVEELLNSRQIEKLRLKMTEFEIEKVVEITSLCATAVCRELEIDINGFSEQDDPAKRAKEFLKVLDNFRNTKQLSKIVLNNFKPMIPKQFHELWKNGLETNEYYLKLCGSGGGGYILGFTEDIQKAKQSLSDYKLEVVYNF